MDNESKCENNLVEFPIAESEDKNNKTRPYRKISDEIRVKLLEMVLHDHYRFVTITTVSDKQAYCLELIIQARKQ